MSRGHYSAECKADGVGCDGHDYENNLACDCLCHGPYAPTFRTNDDVRNYHGSDK